LRLRKTGVRKNRVKGNFRPFLMLNDKAEVMRQALGGGDAGYCPVLF
jgi:hypothetical protein